MKQDIRSPQSEVVTSRNPLLRIESKTEEVVALTLFPSIS
jgi:hypothetical protein